MKAITRYSITLSFSVLLLGLLLNPASADDENPWPEEYTILCSSEENTGLNWDNGKWKRVQFTLTQKLIVKSNDNTCESQARGNDGGIHLGWHSKKVCLNVREMGKKYWPKVSDYCEELFPFWLIPFTNRELAITS